MAKLTYQRTLQIVVGLIYLTFLLKQFFYPNTPMISSPVHVFLAVATLITFMPLKLNNENFVWIGRSIDLCIIIVSFLICLHFYQENYRLETRLNYVDDVFITDKMTFVFGVLAILEGVRRVVGASLLTMIIAFLTYAFFGNYIPGWIGFTGFSLSDMTEIMTMNNDGLFGVTASTAVNFVFYFIMFGAIFSATGGGRVFIDIAMFAAGRLTGGAAKAALIGSSLFGTISGSAVANVTATGVLTIPMMRRSGYTAEQAAAAEAIVSTGGQLMPPVMGVSAFVMADMLGVPYARIALAGIIPAVAFYFALFMIIDLRARKTGVGNINAKDLVFDPVAPRVHLLFSPIFLIGMLIAGYSAPFSAFWACIVGLIIPMMRSNTRYGIKQLFETAVEISRQMAQVSVPLAAVGIIMAVASHSNLALKFVTLLSNLGAGNIYLSLGLVIIGCIIMGMGLPTVAAYIIGSVMFVPALVDLGIDRLAAHFFVMYYCVLSMVTPPVALASYAAAGLAQSDTMKTGLQAFALGVVIFMIPLAFVMDPVLLWSGTYYEIMIAFGGMICATLSWSIFIQGWLRFNLNLVERTLFLLVCVGIIFEKSLTPSWFMFLAAFAVLCLWCSVIKAKVFNMTSQQKSVSIADLTE
ncbi:TRAP transporter permease [Cohaesibacter celericrescens]|uniref:C4-dicarboxylate ABC transporter permease n=1 Tax=Cohaesibacter celericrescens TaxID=2067669 RepID=A0A2N5XXI6_9HYPH|nr:TRAP transporter fused permease subunit [Cohaesibacter celericrescens]PLW79226.1 C4-dicarboxylate ABC transporter permease [Cohaesibacter celericrescens]